MMKKATCQIRTDDPEITSHVLWPAELRWQLIQFEGNVQIL